LKFGVSVVLGFFEDLDDWGHEVREVVINSLTKSIRDVGDYSAGQSHTLFIVVFERVDDVVPHLADLDVCSDAVAESREGDESVLSDLAPLLKDINDELDDLGGFFFGDASSYFDQDDL